MPGTASPVRKWLFFSRQSYCPKSGLKVIAVRHQAASQS
jgi:hypothetical protein